MRNTLRIVLLLFLVVLVLLNYNSIRVLNLAVSFLKQDLDQKINLVSYQITYELSTNLRSFTKAPVAFENFIRSSFSPSGLKAVFVYDPIYRPILTYSQNLPPEIMNILKNPLNHLKNENASLTIDRYYIFRSRYGPSASINPMVLVFDVARVVQLERSTKLLSYSNFVLIGISALLALFFLESAFRPYHLLLQTARSAPTDMPEGGVRNETDFLIATFNGVIARLKQKEAELEKLHQREKARADDVQQLNQDLIRSISSGLLLMDLEKKVRIFNKAAQIILQLSPSEVLNYPYGPSLQKISPLFKEDIDRCFEEKVHINRAEIEIRTRNKELRYLGANIMPLQDRQQNFSGVICLFTDITEFKLLQQHMAQKEKFATLGEMAAGMAHEFRNSLATITGYMQMLDNKVEDDKKRYTTPVRKELVVLQDLVNNFLSFARPVHLQLGPVPLRELIGDCVEDLKASGLADGIDIQINGIWPKVTGDEAMLRQVFVNLLRNAAEATQGTGRAGRIEITGSTALNSKFCVIDIRDNGSGIKPEHASRIFTPFFSTKQHGVGLGLAIVQKLVLQHNGTISVEPLPEGTIFRIQLPIS